MTSRKKTQLLLITLVTLLLTIPLFTPGCSTSTTHTTEPIRPTPRQTKFNATLKQNVLVLDEETINCLKELEDGTLLYTPPTNSPPVQFNENHIIVNSSGEGALHRINNVKPDNENNFILETSQANLEDIFETTEPFGLINYTPTPADVNEERTILKKGVTLDRTNSDKWIIHISKDYAIYEDDRVKVFVTGEFSFNPKIDFILQYGWLGLDYLKFGLGGEEYANLDVKVEPKIPGSYGAFEKEIEIGHIQLGPEPIEVGGVRIMMTPRIPLYIGVKGGTNGKMHAGINETLNYYGGIEYKYYTWSPIGYATPTFVPTLSDFEEMNKADLTAYVKFEVIIPIFAVIGPKAEVALGANPKVDIAQKTTLNPWWTVNLVIWVNAGVDINIFTWYKNSFQTQITNINQPIYDSNHPQGYQTPKPK